MNFIDIKMHSTTIKMKIGRLLHLKTSLTHRYTTFELHPLSNPQRH